MKRAFCIFVVNRNYMFVFSRLLWEHTNPQLPLSTTLVFAGLLASHSLALFLLPKAKHYPHIQAWLPLSGHLPNSLVSPSFSL
jgi:hypothetical protein